MVKLGNIDLGLVTDVARTTKRVSAKVFVSGSIGGYTQDMLSEDRGWVLSGVIDNPTQTQRDQLENLYGEVMLLDVPGLSLFGYVKVTQVAPSYEQDWATRLSYALTLDSVPAIGTTLCQTSDVYLHDLAYRHTLNVFDPHFGRFNVNYSANRLEVDYQFYLDNDSADIETAILEIQAGDNLSTMEIYGWKAAAWSLIGHWGDDIAWDAVAAFVDDGAASHDFRAQMGNRGDALAGIGTISLALGCNRRVLVSITNLLAEGAADLSTDDENDQLLLKVKLIHTSLETARAYPRISYVDGSLGYGIA